MDTMTNSKVISLNLKKTVNYDDNFDNVRLIKMSMYDNINLIEWKADRCAGCIEHDDRVCHNISYPEVTFGTKASCKGCPYNI